MQLQVQYPRFLQDTATRLANEIVLDRIHQRMREFGYSEKIIQRTFLQNIHINVSSGELELDIVSDYTSESGFDVSTAREEGTSGVVVKPTNKKTLSWISNGIRFFSKGHFRRGITPSHIIEKTIAEKQPVLQERLDKETESFFGGIIKS